MNPLVMIDMRSKLKGNTENYNSNTKLNNNFTNIDSKLENTEVRILKDIIEGNKKPIEDNLSAKAMSLDEAVNYIKNGR